MTQRIKELSVPAILCAAMYAVFHWILFIGFVPSASMEPTIQAGSLILGNRLDKEYERLDIVIFTHGHKILVKRIAAGPGDTVYLQKHKCVSVNHEPAAYDKKLIVPPEMYFVLGDNSRNSRDSRYWDDPFIEAGDILAKFI